MTPPFDDVTEIDRLLTTTKSVRRRLDLTRPVPREVVLECMEIACHAPNASNAQEWRWVVVDDPELRKRVGEQYRAITEPPVSEMHATKASNDDERGAAISSSILYLAERMSDVPCIVIPCYDVDAAGDRYRALMPASAGDREVQTDPSMSAAMYASIYPAVWSFQLALHSRGLGSVLTTAHQADQETMATILGIPSSWEQTCLLPVAYTTGPPFNRSPRRPVEDVVIWNRGWSNREAERN